MLLASIAIIIGLSVLILIHEFGHFIAAKKAGLLVEEFGFGFPPRLFSKKIGETKYSFNLLPFGGFVRIHGETGTEENLNKKRSFTHQSIWTRFVIVSAGIAINFLFGWFLLSLVFAIGAPQSVIVTEVASDSPAEVSGLLPGDQLPGFKNTDEFIAFTNSNKGTLVEVEVIRKGESLTVEAIPRIDHPVNEGPFGAAVTDAGFERVGIFRAIWQGLYTSVIGMGEILKAFGALIAGIFTTAQVPAYIVGPVGVFGIAGKLGALGFVYLLQLVGIISLNLAVLNFLPFPALDGGRILFLIIEKIKGSPIHKTGEAWANAVSFVLLIILMVVITGRDIVNLF